MDEGKGANSTFPWPSPGPERPSHHPGADPVLTNSTAPVGCFVEDRLQCFSSLIILLQIFILWIKIAPGPRRAGEARKLPTASQWKQEELPAVEILLWLNSKQEICFKTTR